MRAWRTRLIGLVLATALAASPAWSHPGGSNGWAVIVIDRATVRYSLTLWPATLPPAVAEQIERARAGDPASRAQLLGLVRDKVTLLAHERPCQPGPGAVVPPSPQATSLTLTVEYACGGDATGVLIRDDLFDVLGPDYHTLARIDAAGGATQFVFSPESRETRVTPGGRSADRGFRSFLLLGVEHILSGWDHLLFLLGLLLRGGGWLSLAKIITAFTLAHSITLALAVLDVVALPDRLVEAVIALSIAIVAAENLFLQPVVVRRWLVSFCFGLVHGFGFSSVLRELGLPPDGLLRSLVGFNLGVELGQALVVAVALPALLLVRRTRWESRVVWSSSGAIMLVGVILFVERAFF
jgi:HupE / UreJ protein